MRGYALALALSTLLLVVAVVVLVEPVKVDERPCGGAAPTVYAKTTASSECKDKARNTIVLSCVTGVLGVAAAAGSVAMLRQAR